MAKSRRLTLAQVRAVGRLVDECRERGDNPRAWKAHLLDGLARLVPGAYLTTGELGPPGPTGPRMLAFDDLGATPALRAWQERVQAGEYGANPVGLLVAGLPGRCKTRRRRDVMTDREWYGSAFYTDWTSPTRIDDGILSLYLLDGGGAFMISPTRATGDRPFERRDAKLVHLLQLELAPHLGRSLATSGDPAARLSPRLRQTLDCLLDGDSEKEAALRMGISAATVREYVQALYRQFGVTTRAELMAHFLRRYRQPRLGPGS